PGKWQIRGGLIIPASGIVLRGSGTGENGTTLVAAGHDRRTLIRIAGKDDRTIDSHSVTIVDSYVPVNSSRLRLSAASNFKPGDTVLIRRPSTADWVKLLKMSDLGGGIGLGWKPGTRDLAWDRTITKSDGNEISFDAPITTADS